MQSLWEAVQSRVSCRAWQDRRLDETVLAALQAQVETLKRASGLDFCLYTAQEGKQAMRLSAAMFAGSVSTCALLTGGEDPLSAEKVGYYGQKLVLYATQWGLGTCWVAGTYDRASIPVQTPAGQKLWAVIPIGYAMGKTPVRQKMIRSAIRAQGRRTEEFVRAQIPFDQLPDWVQKGAEAVRLGPSAVNRQPVDLLWQEGQVRAKLRKESHGLEWVDLGIAKYQFEVGAAAQGVAGTWAFGDGGAFAIQ